MRMLRKSCDLALAALALCLLFLAAPPVRAEGVSQGITAQEGCIYYYNEDGSVFTDGYKEVVVDGVTRYYYFQEDGTAFTGGYKAFTKDGQRVYYYFQADGTAYTDGYLEFTVGEKRYYFYFQEDGSAFTGGYKEVILEGKTQYFYFLANGQGFNTGYKTVMIDGKKYYFYFGSDGRAQTDTLKAIPLGDRTAYMLFREDGRAFTEGYCQDGTDHYYFLSNGQAFTTGYKTVKIDGVTYYFYFEDTGKAYTGGWKDVAFGDQSYLYYFRENGRAAVDGWLNLEDKAYYIQPNGRAVVDATYTVDEKLYYFDPTGVRSGPGWNLGSDACYYGNEDGSLLTDTMVGNYLLDKNGRSIARYQVLQFVQQHTTEEMTDQEKIDALYKFVLESEYSYISGYEHLSSSWVWKDSWVSDMATDILEKGGGNCFRYAALMGLLLAEATDLPVHVHHGSVTSAITGKPTPHGWVTVEQEGQWYIYDVEMQKFNVYPEEKCFKVLKSESTIHLESEETPLYPTE